MVRVQSSHPDREGTRQITGYYHVANHATYYCTEPWHARGILKDVEGGGDGTEQGESPKGPTQRRLGTTSQTPPERPLPSTIEEAEKVLREYLDWVGEQPTWGTGHGRCKAHDHAGWLNANTAIQTLLSHIGELEAEERQWSKVNDDLLALEAENTRLREALERIAGVGVFGCCKPIYPDAKDCCHTVARQALNPKGEE